MVDWSEIEKLQADFQQTQQSSSSQKLSERNCIEILNKLQEMKLLDVLHTADGKEYITPQHLSREIRDELYVQGGRINLVDLQQALNIDFSHVEAKSNDLAKSDKRLQLIYGQLIDSSYLDRLAEEINDSLQSTGFVTIAELSKAYDLPGDFLIPEIKSRLGELIDGQFDQHNKDAIFTDAFLARQKAHVRGMLTGATKPTSLQVLTSQKVLSVPLLHSIIDGLIREGRINGTIAGGRSEKATFHPHIYTQTQNQWLDNFYAQNRFLEYDSVTRLGISEAKSYLEKRYSGQNVLFLNTVCVNSTWKDQVAATVDETLANGEWVDVMTLLPSSFTTDDGGQLLHMVLRDHQKGNKSSAAGQIFCETLLVSQVFIDSCMKYFDSLMKVKAEKEAKKSSVLALTADERKEYLSNTSSDSKRGDRKDDRRKKATEGSGSVRRATDSGVGGGAREVKSKGKDKKRLKWEREHQDSNKDKSAHAHEAADFMSKDEIADVLIEKLEDCSADFLAQLAEKLQRPLNLSFQSVVRSVFQLSQQQQKPATKNAETEPEKDRKTKVSRRQMEEELNVMWNNACLFSEGINLFEGETAATLEKHLIRTVCCEIANKLFVMNATIAMTDVSSSSSLTHDMRIKMIALFPEELKLPMTKLNSTLSGKSLADFMTALSEACAHDMWDVKLKPVDKKRERQVIHGHRISLLKQLEGVDEPALALHLASTIIFQSMTGAMVHASGKCVPDVIGRMEEHLERDVYVSLRKCQDLVMRKVMLENESLESDDLKQVVDELSEIVVDVKKLAATTKKKAAG